MGPKRMNRAKWEKQTVWIRGSGADLGCALSFNTARCSPRGAEGRSFDMYHFLSGCAPLTALISGPFRSRLKRSISSLQGPPPLLLLATQHRSSPCSLPVCHVDAGHGDDPCCEVSPLREPSDSGGMGAWRSLVLGWYGAMGTQGLVLVMRSLGRCWDGDADTLVSHPSWRPPVPLLGVFQLGGHLGLQLCTALGW